MKSRKTKKRIKELRKEMEIISLWFKFNSVNKYTIKKHRMLTNRYGRCDKEIMALENKVLKWRNAICL